MKRRQFIKTTILGTTIISVQPLYSCTNKKDNKSLPKGIKYCRAKSRALPLVRETDVLVIGGGAAGVAAAIEASKTGIEVFLVAIEPYLGEDICSNYRYWIDADDKLTSPLARAIWKDKNPPAPLHVKHALDNALINNNINYLFNSYPTDILVDKSNKPAGVIIANRSGRQAIKAKTIIDATPRAVVARMTNAAFSPYPKEKQTFEFTVVGNHPKEGDDISVKKMPTPVTHNNQSFDALTYTINIDMKDASWESFARAEQLIRNKTWGPRQLDSADNIFQVPPDPVKSQKFWEDEWKGASAIDIRAFQPKDEDRIFLLNGCAEVDRVTAKRLTEPVNMIEAGYKIGKAAANKAKKTSLKGNILVEGNIVNGSYDQANINELLDYSLRKDNPVKIDAQKEDIPIIGHYDVMIVGGGTAGAPAAISAARKGAKTLLIEQLHVLGGTSTEGMINTYFYGYIEGFTKEIDNGVKNMGKDHGLTNMDERPKPKKGWTIDWKQEWYRKEIVKAGGDIWFGCIGCGAMVDRGDVKGVVVATPHGKGIVLAKNIIDSTGSADIAIAAGAGYTYTDKSHMAIQGAGLPAKPLLKGYFNTDWTFIDDTDILDAWRTFVVAKDKYNNQYDLGKLLQTRERRRVMGEHEISVLDIYNKRTYPDTISIHYSSFDSHGISVDPFLILKPPAEGHVGIQANVPFRSLIPKGLNNIMVTGLGISAHRDAMPVVRMQAGVQNQGYAAGIIAAESCKSSTAIRNIDIKAIQKQLIQKGNMPTETLEEKDSMPFSATQIEKAVNKLNNEMEGLEIILTDIDKTLPMIEEKYHAASDEDEKVTCAFILGMYGKKTGWKTLVDVINKCNSWDEGWNYTGMGQFGECMSKLDSYIIALGRTGEKQAFDAILNKAKMLTPGDHFSHFRAIAIAFESLDDDKATVIIEKLLDMEGVSGHAVTNIMKAKNVTVLNQTDTSVRNKTLRELILARALYRCGDKNKKGKNILEQYATDIRGHYHLHAKDVLA